MSIANLVKLANYYEVKYKFASGYDLRERSVDFWNEVESESKQLVTNFMAVNAEGDLGGEEAAKLAFNMQSEIDNLVENFSLKFNEKFSKNLDKIKLKEYIELTIQEELESISETLNIELPN
jgi:hypothetical protein